MFDKSIFLKAGLFVAAFSFLVNCSERKILVEANPYLDPMPRKTVTGKAGADPKRVELWNLDKISMGPVWKSSAGTSRRVTVAILGTGVDYTHEDLASNIYVNHNEWSEDVKGSESATDLKDNDGNGYVDDFVGYDFVEDDGLPFDRNGAGTAMAGVIGATANNGKGIRGMLNKVSMVPIRFINASGQFLFPHLIRAMQYAYDQKVDVAVLHLPSYRFGSSAGFGEGNNSVTDVERAGVRQIIAKFEKANISLVVSAGNSGAEMNNTRNLLSEFKNFSNVVIVTSTNKQDARPFIANYGRAIVHTTAPGSKILSTTPGSEYKYVSGTTLAAAHVTGALAMAVGRHYGKLTMKQMLSSLVKEDASDPVKGLEFQVIGGNRLNVEKYLGYLSKL